jgi:hypothetical protein
VTPTRAEFDLTDDLAVASVAAFHAGDPAGVGLMRAARRRTAGLLIAWLLLGCVLLAVIGPPAAAATVLAVGGALVVATWLAFPARWRQAAEAQTRRVLLDPTGSAALGRRVVEFAPTRLVLHTDYSREEFTYGAVLRVRTTPDFLLLTLPGPRPLAVPRAALPVDAFDRLEEELRAAVEGTA